MEMCKTNSLKASYLLKKERKKNSSSRQRPRDSFCQQHVFFSQTLLVDTVSQLS